jgi:2-polyprenyl-6-methoxyphenol hydroxylase-like FAD-dependent oxidoreductase
MANDNHDRRRRVARQPRAADSPQASRRSPPPCTDRPASSAAAALEPTVVFPKLLVGHASDPAERAADAAADRALTGLPARAPRTVPAVDAVGGTAIDSHTEASIARIRSQGGRPLDEAVRAKLEPGFGVDLSSVRVHTGAEPDRLNRSLQARAFTTGNDIFFRDGSYQPHSGDGLGLVAHEIAHVVQEGSVARRSFGPIRRLTDEQSSTLLARIAKLDYGLLTDLAAKAALVGDLDKAGGNREENESLKQTILFSPVAADKLRPLLATPAKLRVAATKAKPRSSSAVLAMVDACRAIATDFYRFESAKPQAHLKVDLSAAAKSYDSAGAGASDLRHKEKSKGLFNTGLLSRTKTRTHTMADVTSKVIAVSAINLRAAQSPTALRSTGDAPQSRPRVGVVGGGPIGLMAALESLVQGAEVVIFEARGDEYSRRQVLALDSSTTQRLARYGVKWELLDSNTRGSGNLVAVKYIEKLLRERCLELGVEIRTGWSLVGAQRGDGDAQTSATFQVGRDQKAPREKERLDLLVVAAGAGVARANKYTGACIADELGIQYDVQEAKDYAAVGLFEPTQTGNLRDKDTSGGGAAWAYRFNTPKVTYILRQIPAELHQEFMTDPDGTKKLEAFIKDRAKNHFEMGDDATLAKDRNKMGQRAPNVGVFPIEIQQAKGFVNEKMRALLIGDAAATPHPHSGSGLNTGMREIDALGDVVAAMRARAEARSEDRGSGAEAPGEESEAQVNAAIKRYDAELKTLTDGMVAKATKILAEQHGKYLDAAIAALERDAGALLASDYALGQRVEGVKRVAAKAMAKDSEWSSDDKLEFLVKAQKDVADVRKQIDQLRSGS